MGADYLGWRSCPLQNALGPADFLGKLKLRAYRRVIEEQVPEDRRAELSIQIQVTGRENRTLNYPGILSELGSFEAGIPDCASCPLSPDKTPLGCYHYITYPIEVIAEKVIFDFFCAEIAVPNAIPNQLWRDVVSQVSPDSAWYRMRGKGNTLAATPEPLTHTFTWQGQPHTVDSAQVLEGLFVSLNYKPTLVAYALFFSQLDEYVQQRLAQTKAAAQRGDIASLQEASTIAASNTLKELGRLAPMLLQVVARYEDEDWTVYVDS